MSIVLWALVGLSAVLAGRALVVPATITPPGDPAAPVEIVLLDHGYTSSLVVPHEKEWTRYAYGDWRYYAEGRKGIFNAARALFWPTTGTLGRRGVDFRGGDWREAVPVVIERYYSIPVDRSGAGRLAGHLDALYEETFHTALENPAQDMVFVRHPHRYSILYNSNHAVADWLRIAGCRVRGPTMRSRWRIRR